MTTATLINCFTVDPDHDDEFLTLWRQADELLRVRHAYASTRLHKALLPNAQFRYINVAELASVETWRTAIGSPEFAAISAQMTQFQPVPGLYAVEVSQTTSPATPS